MESSGRVVKLSSSATLQELWNAIQEACSAQHATTIDLEGGSFSGRVNGLKLMVCEGTKTMYEKALSLAPTHPVVIQNGQIDLGRYSMLVTSGTCCLKNVELSGQGPAWRRRGSACLLHVTGRKTRMQLEGSSIQCTATEPINTVLLDQGAELTLLQSKVSQSSAALGVKVLGGMLQARDSEFQGHHECIAIFSAASAIAHRSKGAVPCVEESSMAKLEDCRLTGTGASAVGTLCTVIGVGSSLTAARCQVGLSAVGVIVSRGGWLVIEDCTISQSSVAAVWCSGGHGQATDCQFHSHHPLPAVRIERKGSMELCRCEFRAPELLPLGANAVGLSINGAGAFARSVDCRYEGFGPSAIMETAGGSFLVEEGVEDAIRLG